MKNIFTCAFAFLLIASHSFAQSSYTSINYKNALRPALALPLIYKTDIAEQTILSKLKETGYKPVTSGNIFKKTNKQDGFYIFPGVQLPELANQKLDLYFKVDPRNGDSSYNSSISLMVSKGYDNFVSPEIDSATFGAAQRFLNSFVTKTETFQINKSMDDQKKIIAASEKKWQDLRNKQDEANKKIAQLQADIQNLKQQEDIQKQDLDKQRAALQDLEARRSAVPKQ